MGNDKYKIAATENKIKTRRYFFIRDYISKCTALLLFF
jgi:hypothetical protein